MEPTQLHQSLRLALGAESEYERTWPGRVLWYRPNKALLMTGTIALLASIIFLDIITGPEIHFPIAYLAPAALATWYAGSRYGYFMAIVDAAGQLYAEVYGAAIYTQPYIVYWNTGSRLIVFCLMVALLSVLQKLSLRMRMIARERADALRQLARQLSRAEDSEQQVLSSELRENVSQGLSLLKMHLTAQLKEQEPDSGSSRQLRDALAVADELIQRANKLTHNLYPPMLDQLGLVATLRHYCEALHNKTGIELVVSEEGTPHPLSRAMATDFFLCTEELISNAVTHGKPRAIVTSVNWTPTATSIIVDDDGSGFDQTSTLSLRQTQCLGLVSVHERLLSLGGSFRIESGIGKGTRVTLEAPITK